MKIKNLPWPVLGLTVLGLYAVIFGLSAVSWWLAHQLAWWTFAASATAGNLTWSTIKATRAVVRERRQRAA